jgi:hypothetical protein
MDIRGFTRSVSVVVAFALMAGLAQAGPISWVGSGSQNGTIIGNALSYTRATYNSNIDRIDIHLTGFITAGFGAGNQELQLLEGTWTASPGKYIYLGGDASTWASMVTNNNFLGQAPPQTYVNLDQYIPGGLTTYGWTASGLHNSTFTTAWYTVPASGPTHRLTPVVPPENVGVFDNTLLATLFVSTGADVSFAGNPSWGGWGFTNSVILPQSISGDLDSMSPAEVFDAFEQSGDTYKIAGSFSTGANQPTPTINVPEPTMIALLLAGALGLIGCAWRRRASRG